MVVFASLGRIFPLSLLLPSLVCVCGRHHRVPNLLHNPRSKAPASHNVGGIAHVVFTSDVDSANHPDRLRSIKSTWGARIWSNLFFVANEAAGNPGGAAVLDEKMLTPPPELISDTHKRIWAFEEVSKKWPDYEWFAFSNDNTMFVEENLRQYLGTLDPKEPHFLGSRLSTNGITFNSASAMVHSALVLASHLPTPLLHSP
jgi:hypothetical protein